MKDIHMFLFTTEKKELKPLDKNNPSAEWVRIEDAAAKISWQQDKEFFQRHLSECNLL